MFDQNENNQILLCKISYQFLMTFWCVKNIPIDARQYVFKYKGIWTKVVRAKVMLRGSYFFLLAFLLPHPTPPPSLNTPQANSTKTFYALNLQQIRLLLV